MMMCDYCGNFYHTECIGCSIMAIRTYKCQLCLINGMKKVVYTLDIQKIHLLVNQLYIRKSNGKATEVVSL